MQDLMGQGQYALDVGVVVRGVEVGHVVLHVCFCGGDEVGGGGVSG